MRHGEVHMLVGQMGDPGEAILAAGGRIAERCLAILDRISAGGRAPSVREAGTAYGPRATARELMEQRRAAVKALREELGRAAQDASPRGQRRLARQLEELARSWRLSPSNRALLLAQRPESTLVLSPAAWERLGRTPRPGERPLHLIAPARGRALPYVAAPVLDVAQTQGKRLATPAPVRGRALTVALEQAWSSLAPGRRAPAGGARELLAGLARLRLAQERAVEAELRELEAEAVGFVVLRALGAGAKAPPSMVRARRAPGGRPRVPGLRAWHGRSGAGILVSLSRIQRAARAILAATGALEVRPRG